MVGFQVSGNGEPATCTFDGAPAAAAGPPAATATPRRPRPPAGGGTMGGFTPYADMTLYPQYNLTAARRPRARSSSTWPSSPTAGPATRSGAGSPRSPTRPRSPTSPRCRPRAATCGSPSAARTATRSRRTAPRRPRSEAAYQSVISAYNLQVHRLRHRGRGDRPTPRRTTCATRRSPQLEQADPGLQVSYTLPVLPTGLTSDGVAVLQSAETYGASIAAVNVMAMDYGSSFPGDMATLAEQAATATAAQVQSVWTSLTTAQALAKIAITPMIGVNDAAPARPSPWPTPPPGRLGQGERHGVDLVLVGEPRQRVLRRRRRATPRRPAPRWSSRPASSARRSAPSTTDQPAQRTGRRRRAARCAARLPTRLPDCADAPAGHGVAIDRVRRPVNRTAAGYVIMMSADSPPRGNATGPTPAGADGPRPRAGRPRARPPFALRMRRFAPFAASGRTHARRRANGGNPPPGRARRTSDTRRPPGGSGQRTAAGRTATPERSADDLSRFGWSDAPLRGERIDDEQAPPLSRDAFTEQADKALKTDGALSRLWPIRPARSGARTVPQLRRDGEYGVPRSASLSEIRTRTGDEAVAGSPDLSVAQAGGRRAGGLGAGVIGSGCGDARGSNPAPDGCTCVEAPGPPGPGASCLYDHCVNMITVSTWSLRRHGLRAGRHRGRRVSCDLLLRGQQSTATVAATAGCCCVRVRGRRTGQLQRAGDVAEGLAAPRADVGLGDAEDRCSRSRISEVWSSGRSRRSRRPSTARRRWRAPGSRRRSARRRRTRPRCRPAAVGGGTWSNSPSFSS